MSGVISRIQERTGSPDEQPRVLDVDDEDADAVLDALSSETGRTMFRTLFDRPGTPSEIAARCDTSVQNVNYHFSNLESAGLIEPIDTVYSEKGNEMTVYGPANDPIVFVGDESRRPAVQQSITDLAAGVGLLAVASLLVQWGAERLVRAGPAGTLGPASTTAPQPTPTSWPTVFVFDILEPGLLFFCGCLAIVGLLAVLPRFSN